MTRWRRLGVIAELCYGHFLVVGRGFGEPVLGGEKGGREGINSGSGHGPAIGVSYWGE